jgi:Carboxypeptidase regulatory-like domain/TonB dependent receptor
MGDRVSLQKLTARMACLLLLAWVAPAQTVQGVVTGTVSDPTGASIPNAQVTLTNEGTQVAQNANSGSDGGYRFSLVPPGTYTLLVKAPGFSGKQTKGIIVNASQTVPLDVKLDVATASTAIEVTTQSTIVQTATSTLATTVNTATIENMPLLTRNVFDLAFVAPQVSQGMNFGPSSGGARESGTVFLMNGADNNDNFDEGLPNVVPPLESVAEFSILTNQFSAEYGRGSGAVVSAVQKSGTNGFHGAAYEFHRDRTISSNDFFSNRGDQPKPKFIRNQFGGEVDGPINRDKTFFAFAYDRVDVRTGSNLQIQVPTGSELAAMTTGAGPLASYFLTKYPLRTSEIPCPNEPAEAFGHIGCFNTFDAIPTTQNTYFGRVDHNFSPSDRLSFTANVQRYTNVDAYGGSLNLGTYSATVQPFPSTDAEHFHQLGLVETHTFSPILVNEFTAAHNRHFSDVFEGNGNFTDPEILVDGAAFGFSSTSPAFGIGPNSEYVVTAFTQDRWQFQDNLGWTLGKHSLKIGGGWQYGQLYRNWDLGGPGYYQFSDTTGTALPVVNPNGTIGNPDNPVVQTDSNFQHDFPYYQEIAVDPRTGAKANAYRHYIGQDGNVFINDDWKVSRNFTLNLGLRWEHFGAPREANKILAQFTNLSCLSIQCIADARVNPVSTMWKPQYHDFAPRVGFAWDVRGDGKTAIRGGYGIFYDRIFDNVWSNAAWNPPFYALVDHDATGGDLIFYSVPAQAGPAYDPAVGPGRVSVRAMDVALRDQYEQSFHFTIEQQLASSFLFRIGYQGSLGRHLPVLMDLNRYDGDAYNPDLARQRPNALYSTFNYRANNVSSNYNALVTEFQKRFSNGLQFQFGYTWSKLLDFNSALFAGESTQGTYSQPYYYVTNSNFRNEYGPGGFDHTHSFKFSYVYELPFLRNSKSIVGRVLGGWQISGFYQGYSGHPLEVYNSRTRSAGDFFDANGVPENLGGDYNLDGNNNDHPIYMGPANPYSGKSPADGIFIDNNPVGCGIPGGQSSAAAIASCNSDFGVGTPNSVFFNPPGGPIRYGLGRNVFRGPWFNNFDAAISKTFAITERLKLQFRADAVNVLNHPNFDCIDTDVNSGTFGRALCVAGGRGDNPTSSGIYGPTAGGSWSNGVARRFQFSAKIFF